MSLRGYSERGACTLAGARQTHSHGKRKRAIPAILLGWGLRRRELAELTLENLQPRRSAGDRPIAGSGPTWVIYGDVVTDEMAVVGAKVAQLAFQGEGAQNRAQEE